MSRCLLASVEMRPHYPVFFISSLTFMKGEQICVRTARHCGAPALMKILLVFVFLGVYTVGFFGKTFLKHETWDCRWEAEVWQLHQSPGRHGVSLSLVTSLPPGGHYPPLRPLTAQGIGRGCQAWWSPLKRTAAARKGSSSETFGAQNRGRIGP